MAKLRRSRDEGRVDALLAAVAVFTDVERAAEALAPVGIYLGVRTLQREREHSGEPAQVTCFRGELAGSAFVLFGEQGNAADVLACVAGTRSDTMIDAVRSAVAALRDMRRRGR